MRERSKAITIRANTITVEREKRGRSKRERRDAVDDGVHRCKKLVQLDVYARL